MSILVSGSNGFIAGICADILIDSGYEVIGLDNLSSSYLESLSVRFLTYIVNIQNEKLLDRIFRNHHIDFVFHFAAESIIGKSMTDPAIFFDTNVKGGITLLNAMRKHGVSKIIHSSTSSTYGNPLYVPIDENHPQNPINAYGESKYLFERILNWYQKAYGLNYVMFRYFNVGGSFKSLYENRKEETRLLPVIMECIKNNKTLQVFGNDYPTKDGSCIRDYLHVVDVANAHILSMQNFENVKNDVYNLGSEKGFSVLEIIKLCEKITGHKINYEFADRRFGDPPVLIASRDKAINKLGWKPELSNLEQIIKDTWRCFNR